MDLNPRVGNSPGQSTVVAPLTTYPERGTLSSMAVACTLGASTPAGSIPRENNLALVKSWGISMPTMG